MKERNNIEKKNDINDFYRNGTHLEAMKQSKTFSSKIELKRKSHDQLMNWKEAKKVFFQN